MSQRRRVALIAAILAVSATAAAGIWKRAREGRGALPPSTLPRPSQRLPASRATVAAAPVPNGGGTFRGDAQRRHRSPHAGPREPRLKFELALGGQIAAMPVLTPEGDVIVATVAGKVMRISGSGGVVWTADLGDRIYGTPLVRGDLVMVGSDADLFFGLSPADGTKRWSLRLDGDCDTSPAEGRGGVVLVAAHDHLYAVKPSGSVLWRVRTWEKIYAAPAVGPDGASYVGSKDDHLHAISAKGDVLWRRDMGGDVNCAPAIGDNGRIYAGSDAGQIVAFQPEGTVRWRADAGGLVRGGLTISRAGSILAGVSGLAPRIVALDADTGAERWSFRIPKINAQEHRVPGAPLEDAELNLYFGSHDRIYALDKTGNLLWSHAASGDVDAPVALGPGGVLYAASRNGAVIALH